MLNKIDALKDTIANAKDATVKQFLQEKLDDEVKKLATKEKERKYWIKQKLMLHKAEKQGIKVTEEEINAEYNKLYPNK
jgi:methanogenic corrinoid protein MtbC1